MQRAPGSSPFARLPSECGLCKMFMPFSWSARSEINATEVHGRHLASPVMLGVRVDPGLGLLNPWLDSVRFVPVLAASALVGAVLMWKPK